MNAVWLISLVRRRSTTRGETTPSAITRRDHFDEYVRPTNDRPARNRLKKEISVAIAAVLAIEDFDSIPIVVEAARRAIAEST
jgi:hypothetical protein